MKRCPGHQPDLPEVLRMGHTGPDQRRGLWFTQGSQGSGLGQLGKAITAQERPACRTLRRHSGRECRLRKGAAADPDREGLHEKKSILNDHFRPKRAFKNRAAFSNAGELVHYTTHTVLP